MAENLPIQVKNISFFLILSFVKISYSAHAQKKQDPNQEDVEAIQEVVVEGNSAKKKYVKSGFNAKKLDLQNLKQLDLDINQVLNQTSGIRIREVGGLGSSFELSLNGLSGNQIRYYLDGLPMNYFGSSMALNNIPVSFIDNITVFKGVVPVEFGGDALGGVIAIDTGIKKKTQLDLSYGFSSFNTHRADLNGQWLSENEKIFAKILSYFNYSDNDYLMREVPVYDLSLGNLIGYESVNRFHNSYDSNLLRGELGILNQAFADEISLSFTTANNHKEYQHPDNTITRVFGDLYTEDKTMLVDLDYRKSYKSFEFDAKLMLGETKSVIADSSRYRYNWLGDSVRRQPEDLKGEASENRSLYRLKDSYSFSKLGVKFSPSNSHKFKALIQFAPLKRQGFDELNPNNRTFKIPSTLENGYLGLSYDYSRKENRLELNTFLKAYQYKASITTQDYEDRDVLTENSFARLGYGLAVSKGIHNNLLLKLSGERSYRMPDALESLGDGMFVLPNPNLNPEESWNLNIGLNYKASLEGLRMSSQTNLFYRNASDFIRYLPQGPFGSFENLSKVLVKGIETSVNLNVTPRFSSIINFTYQDIRDNTPKDEGLENVNYKSRVPNIPSLFGNLTMFYSLGKISREPNWKLTASLNYTDEFFLSWKNLGDSSSKKIIPTQFTQDLGLIYTSTNNRYAASLMVFNLSDALAFDNFNIQKPGRRISLKIRYRIN